MVHDNAKKKETRLTIYMMNEHIKTKQEALSVKASEKSLIDVTLGDQIGSFYYAFNSQREPQWLSFLKDGLSEDIKLQSSSASGLLLLETDGRIFAIAFGYGRSLLDISNVEPRFGLMVCLNRINPQKMRKINKKAYEDLVTQTSTQLSKDSSLPIFEIDESRDILSAVTGIPRDQSMFGRRLSGSESLVVSKCLKLEDLSSFCHELFLAFSDDSYREQFGWVDQLALLKEPSLIAQLDECVVEDCKKKDTRYTYLAAPEVIDWQDIESFTIEGTGNQQYEDLDMDQYLTELGSKLGDLTIRALKRRKVSIKYLRSNVSDVRWNIYKCIVSEHKIENDLFVLMAGQWFRVASSLAQKVDGYVEGIGEVPVDLPKSERGELEADYNKRVAETSDNTIFVLDGITYKPEGASSPVELCDLCTSDGFLIHVKRKTRSSTLSHLFSQGMVGAETLIGDRVFRQRVRNKIYSNTGINQEGKKNLLELFPEEMTAADASNFHVAFAILDSSNRDLVPVDLPFFSKLNLLNIGKNISMRGFKVNLSLVGSSS